MVCLGFEPGAAGWQAQTKPRSYGGHPFIQLSLSLFLSHSLYLSLPIPQCLSPSLCFFLAIYVGRGIGCEVGGLPVNLPRPVVLGSSPTRCTYNRRAMLVGMIKSKLLSALLLAYRKVRYNTNEGNITLSQVGYEGLEYPHQTNSKLSCRYT